MNAANDRARLFYALWPDEHTRAQLAALQSSVAGRPVPAANLHLTLAFLGAQKRQWLPVLSALLAQLPSTAFTLEIDTYAYFRKHRIAWAGPTSPPAALALLHQSLWQALMPLSLSLKADPGFRPHVTLARDAAPVSTPLTMPVRWKVGEIALVESIAVQGGVRYVPLALRSLGA